MPFDAYGHTSDASLLRELSRNGQLKHLCGFGFGKTPQACNLSRFRGILLKRLDEVEAIFANLCDYLYGALKGFGEEGSGAGQQMG